jgi:carboxymethylenebutenolidase
MKKYGKDFEYIVYPDTGHAFFNETNPVTYNKEAAEDAWKKLLEFLAGKMV